MGVIVCPSVNQAELSFAVDDVPSERNPLNTSTPRLRTVLIVLIAFASFTAGVVVARTQEHPATDRFQDLAEHPWAWDAIAWAADEGLICGVAPGYFAPARPLTRAQVATILYRVEHPGARPECPPPLTPTTAAPGIQAWENTTWIASDGETVHRATLYPSNQPRRDRLSEDGPVFVDVTCWDESQSAYLIPQFAFALTHINFAEVRRDENLEVYWWMRWAFFANGERVGDWEEENRRRGAR